MVSDRWSGDLRRLAADAGPNARALARLLTDLPGIGPTGADVFLREAQRVWPWLRPRIDAKVLEGARIAGLPRSRAGLAAAFEGHDAAALGAALVRLTIVQGRSA